MTLRELMHAVDGYMEAHGIDTGPDYDALLEMLEQDTGPSPSIKNQPGTKNLF